MRQPAQIAPSKYSLKALSGSDKGATFALSPGRITIGRGDDNHIIIGDDPKVSRNHAVIVITSRGAEISDVSDHNKVLVNGEEVTSRALTPGVVIQLGETKFLFSNQAEAPAALKPVPSQGLSFQENSVVDAPNRRVKKSRNRSAQSKSTFYIFIGVILLIAIWLFNSTTKKPQPQDLRTDKDIEADITASQKLVENAETERANQGLGTPEYAQAQPNFVKGFRDYHKGQYERAIDSFQACLALFPTHVQCQRYLALSRKKFNELIQYQIVLARKYKDQNQYGACQASFRNAMFMIKDATDSRYKEAKAGFDACRTLQGVRY